MSGQSLVAPELVLVPPSAQTLERLREFDAAVHDLPQADIRMDHLIHGGMYVRTAHIPADTIASGAVMSRATVLIVNGDVTIFTGTHAERLTGYHVLPGSPGRKQLFRTHANTQLTMVLPSTADTVDEAEHEFTDDAEQLRKFPGNVTITGERA